MAKTYLQIQEQIAQLQTEAEALRKKEAGDVLARIKEAIAVYGFTAQDLGLARRGPTAKKAVSGRKRTNAKSRGAKYKDDAGNVWSGRGPRPTWFKAALESGKTPEDLAV